VFHTPYAESSLNYFINDNIAYCEFGEGCDFLQNIFPTSFPEMKIRRGTVIDCQHGKKYSNRHWRSKFKCDNHDKLIEIQYTGEIKESSLNGRKKLSPPRTYDFIPCHVLFEQLKEKDLTNDKDRELYKIMVNKYDFNSLDFQQCGRWRGNSLYLIV
jgi:hypothetical protein